MDLSKRLANLDRLSRKKKSSPEGKTDLINKLSKTSTCLFQDSLTSLGLRPAGEEKWPVWIKDYSEKLIDPIENIPSMHGFFTRAAEASPEPEDILFLDTETTGLAGGTGTIAFLVGVGWIRDGHFISRLYFLPDFAHETHMLKELHLLAQGFDVVMTFNGASFDLPLLRTRALMNRLEDPCAHLVSWDLLVPGRRLWGRTFSDCRQQTLERGLLNIVRGADDIDGALIPQTWFDFIKDGKGELMYRVLHHNQKDLLGMAGIFSRVLDMARLLTDIEFRVDHWLQAWALGRIAEKAGLQKEASVWIQQAMFGPPKELHEGKFQVAFAKDAIRLLKREKAWLAVETVINQASQHGLSALWLHREAAILFEHRLKRLDLALFHARLCEEMPRVKRLEKKIANHEGNND